jgi:hypothetical protein
VKISRGFAARNDKKGDGRNDNPGGGLWPCMVRRCGVIGRGLIIHLRRDTNMIAGESVPPDPRSPTGIRAIEIDRFAGFCSGIVRGGL